MALDEQTLSQLLDSLDRFVRERLIPLERQVADDDEIPPDVIVEMREMGLFGISIPESYGGLGLSMEEETRVNMVMGQATPSFRVTIGGNVGIGSQGLVIDGTEEQKQKYLPKMASGEFRASFALTEPDSGSDAAALKTSAVRDGDHYILNGVKRFITNAQVADVITVMARTDPDAAKAAGISAFVVEAGTPGLSFGKREEKMGQRGTHISDVIFDDCRVPADNLIGGVEGQGFKTAMKVLDRGRMSIAAASVGAAERLIRECVKYGQERQQFGKPIIEFQLIQAMLADSQADTYAARSMVIDAARKKDGGGTIIMEAACCKMFATEMAGRIADRAVQIFGGSGYIADFPVERFFRDLRVFRIYEGTTQIQQLVIARELLKD